MSNSPVTQTHHVSESDVDVLNSLSNPSAKVGRKANQIGSRRPSMDPMILALAAAKPPTHNHYQHDWFGMDCTGSKPKRLPTNYQSQQKPRKERLSELKHERKNSRSKYYLILPAHQRANPCLIRFSAVGGKATTAIGSHVSGQDTHPNTTRRGVLPSLYQQPR